MILFTDYRNTLLLEISEGHDISSILADIQTAQTLLALCHVHQQLAGAAVAAMYLRNASERTADMHAASELRQVAALCEAAEEVRELDVIEEVVFNLKCDVTDNDAQDWGVQLVQRHQRDMVVVNDDTMDQWLVAQIRWMNTAGMCSRRYGELEGAVKQGDLTALLAAAAEFRREQRSKYDNHYIVSTLQGGAQ